MRLYISITIILLSIVRAEFLILNQFVCKKIVKQMSMVGDISISLGCF